MTDISTRDIDYIPVHGTAADRGDAAESQAASAIYGDNAPLSPLKDYFGHTLGAYDAPEVWMSL